MTPMTSLSFMMRRSSPSSLMSVPDHLPNRMRSPTLHVERHDLAALVSGARADGDHLAFLRLLLGGVGDDDAPFRSFFRVDALDHDAVVQRAKLHYSPPFSLAGRCPRAKKIGIRERSCKRDLQKN